MEMAAADIIAGEELVAKELRLKSAVREIVIIGERDRDRDRQRTR